MTAATVAITRRQWKLQCTRFLLVVTTTATATTATTKKVLNGIIISDSVHAIIAGRLHTSNEYNIIYAIDSQWYWNEHWNAAHAMFKCIGVLFFFFVCVSLHSFYGIHFGSIYSQSAQNDTRLGNDNNNIHTRARALRTLFSVHQSMCVVVVILNDVFTLKLI